MRAVRLSLHRFDSRFRTVVRHASAARDRTETVIVSAHVASGETGYGEACPRAYVTGESIDSIQRFFHRHRAGLEHQVIGLASLLDWRDRHAEEIGANPSAYCAIELALLDAIARTEGVGLDALLSLPPPVGEHRYSAVLGDSPWLAYRFQLQRYRRAGFRDFKLKLSPDPRRNQGKVAAFRGARGNVRVRADANNLWPDAAACIAALAPLDFPWFAIEEPAAAHALDEFRAVSRALNTRIVLDESFLDGKLLPRLAVDAPTWILNFRVSKLGGLTRAVELARDARRQGLAVIVGAHVGETSILTRAGMLFAQAAGDDLVAREGAFGTHLLREDIVKYPLMFGDGGLIPPEAISVAPGLGLDVDASKLKPVY